MPFIQDILSYNSVAIVGMAKNTGKTSCLNYVLDRLDEENANVAVTSIGVDGEERDVLYDTPKPRIELKKGNLFVTSEKHFSERELQATVLAVSDRSTALGPLVTARAESTGKVVLSGPSDTYWLHQTISSLGTRGVDITLVDGALSRMSLASPAVTDAMILCTGAALSPQLQPLIKKTKYLCSLINLKQVDADLCKTCDEIEGGVWLISAKGELVAKMADSLFTSERSAADWLSNSDKRFFIHGALTDSFLKMITASPKVDGCCLIVKDFSKIFVTPSSYDKFLRRGGEIQVLQKAKLLGVCSNPTSPEGYHYEAEVLRSTMESELQIPVYDIFQEIKKIKLTNIKSE